MFTANIQLSQIILNTIQFFSQHNFSKDGLTHIALSIILQCFRRCFSLGGRLQSQGHQKATDWKSSFQSHHPGGSESHGCPGPIPGRWFYKPGVGHSGARNSKLTPRKQLCSVEFIKSSLPSTNLCSSPWGSGVLRWACCVEIRRHLAEETPCLPHPLEFKGMPTSYSWTGLGGDVSQPETQLSYSSTEKLDCEPHHLNAHNVSCFTQKRPSPHPQPAVFNHGCAAARIKPEMYKLPTLNCLETRDTQPGFPT